ncbi:D-alanine--D-alanine ligase [Pseudoclavibacter endophyticus]|uniref:D-alanine--D-alanine ligase n=1 Tax=Pseudoclavibacter endophyticus TaxID=1778590 RepID=A0A6H9WR30_9MICO|nr:D-alanine--D-alanine ligase [Pseudoclavibacter endophyticus]KAB1648780.1 D-alanine--D-alanine ligase [Pseudoclavibacter endophyticus]GGA68548.1 D-alanine--D-alanine ligase [Pseudoclavibacter endophyticus]
MSKQNLHVVVLAGGISHERDVSLRSGRRVTDALQRAGMRVELIDPDAGLLGHLADSRPDVVWPVLHGASGEDGALYSLLRAIRLPYVGAKPGGARLAWDKGAAKVMAKRAGLRSPESIVLPNTVFRELGASSVIDAIGAGLTLPAVVKPLEGGSAQGVSFVETLDDFRGALVTALTYFDTALIERKIEGTEVMVGVVDRGEGPFAIPAVEVVPNGGVFDYGARYNAGETTYYAPARLDEDVATKVAAMARSAYETIGLRDLARVDMIVDDAGEPWFIEADPIPGLTETSIVPLGIEAAGLDLTAVYADLVRAAATRGHVEQNTETTEPASTAAVDAAAALEGGVPGSTGAPDR